MTEQDINDSRRREDASIRTEQRLIDFIAQYERDREVTALAYMEDKKASLEWRTAMDLRMKPVEKMMETLTTPAAIVKWCIIGTLTPFLSWFGFLIFKKLLLAAQGVAWSVPK